MFTIGVVTFFYRTSIIVVCEVGLGLWCVVEAKIRFIKFCLFHTMVLEFLFHSVDVLVCMLAGL